MVLDPRGAGGVHGLLPLAPLIGVGLFGGGVRGLVETSAALHLRQHPVQDVFQPPPFPVGPPPAPAMGPPSVVSELQRQRAGRYPPLLRRDPLPVIHTGRVQLDRIREMVDGVELLGHHKRVPSPADDHGQATFLVLGDV
ncbi:hypothetical protein SAMN05421812_13519 [Asanoa hainanensis]|uniref:Uncharacterized protein n=1 Tax=Asanoa hainanensis TaxID=560556 RepID=A0A239PI07_9ACTN|nr:hypothetical protein SAMN05421812_13519 [Asanoa hainanensis]